MVTMMVFPGIQESSSKKSPGESLRIWQLVISRTEVLTIAEFQQALEKFGFQLAPEDERLLSINLNATLKVQLLCEPNDSTFAGCVEDHAPL